MVAVQIAERPLREASNCEKIYLWVKREGEGGKAKEVSNGAIANARLNMRRFFSLTAA